MRWWRLLLLVVVALVVADRVLESPVKEEAVTIDYEEAVRAAAERAAPLDGAALDEAVARFATFFSDLTSDGVRARIGATYAEEIYFDDTVKTITRRDVLEAYMVHTAAGLSSCRVELGDVAATSPGFYVRWRMEYVAPKLNGGRPVVSYGVSHLVFDDSGRIILHRDFWDSTGGLFEHIPALGWAIRKIKARL